MSFEYRSRINRVVDYIEKHLDHNLTLEELAAVASFSKYHFHRIFYSMTGETLFQFIQRIRIEKAATLLAVDPSKSVTEIAYECGFTNVSSFARSFKNTFGVSASAWRAAKSDFRNFDQLDRNLSKVLRNECKEFPPLSRYIEYAGNIQIWRVMMENQERKVEVKELPDMMIAYVRHVGPYAGDGQLFNRLYEKLFTWAASHNLLQTPHTPSIALYHDNPEITDQEKLRLSLGIPVSEKTEVSGEIGKMTIAGGKYAITRFTISAEEFSEAWQWVYGAWLPQSGYVPDDRPCYEYYPGEQVGDRYVVDICVPVKHI